MNEQKANARESLQGLSQGDATKLGFLQDIIAHSYTESGLDPQTFMLGRMAAFATLDTVPASWRMKSERERSSKDEDNDEDDESFGFHGAHGRGPGGRLVRLDRQQQHGTYSGLGPITDTERGKVPT